MVQDWHWGRQYSYGGLGLLPSSKSLVLRKGHHHFANGADITPRDVKLYQPYELTHIKKSAVRAHDELQPKPVNIENSKYAMEHDPGRENAYSSHQSRFQIFPSPDRLANRNHVHAEKSILKKTAGNFARIESIPENLTARSYVAESNESSHQNRLNDNSDREKCSPNGAYINNETVDEENTDIHSTYLPSIKYINDFFSRHSTISEFNKRFPSQTPALSTRNGRRPADWHLKVATHTVGR